MPDSHQGGWAVVGKIGALLGLALLVTQLYGYFIAKEVYVEAQGMCRQFIVPDTYLQNFKGDIFPTYQEIEKLLPEKLDDKRIIALDIEKGNLGRQSKLNTAAEKLDDIHSFCSFTITNTGNKEAQDINLELPREGIYLINKLGESSKEAEFTKVISVGKLNPGGRIKIATWNKDFASEVNTFERSDFRLTHTLGISEVEFLSENNTWIGWLYETYPNISFLLLMAVVILVGWIGIYFGKASEQLKAQQAKKLQDEKEQLKQKAPPEPVADVDPPSPS